MVFKTYIPQPALRQSIDLLYLNYADHFEATTTTLPLLNQEIVFNLGDLFEVQNAAQTYTTRGLTSWVSGIHTTPVITRAKGRHVTLGILFKPWGLYQTLGISPMEATNNAIDGQHLLRGVLENFVREQFGQYNDNAFLMAFEQHLLKVSVTRSIRQEIIRSVDTIAAIEKQKGAFERIARELSLSSKSFIQVFNTTVGLSPLQYVQLKRINKALTLIWQYPGKSLTDIAYELGFFDQAHFIRVFKSFCGISPKAYRSLLQGEGKFYTISNQPPVSFLCPISK